MKTADMITALNEGCLDEVLVGTLYVNQTPEMAAHGLSNFTMGQMFCLDDAKLNAAKVQVLMAALGEAEKALAYAVSKYGKEGGPWNVPGDAGGWISRARKALTLINQMKDKKMNLTDCKTLDEALKWLEETEEPYENIYMPNAVKALQHAYNLGLLRGAELGEKATKIVEEVKC